MTTPLDKTLKRELNVDGRAFIVALSPDGVKLTLKGRRLGLELRWTDLVNGEAALAVALNASVGKFAQVSPAPDRRRRRRLAPLGTKRGKVERGAKSRTSPEAAALARQGTLNPGAVGTAMEAATIAGLQSGGSARGWHGSRNSRPKGHRLRIEPGSRQGLRARARRSRCFARDQRAQSRIARAERPRRFVRQPMWR